MMVDAPDAQREDGGMTAQQTEPGDARANVAARRSTEAADHG